MNYRTATALACLALAACNSAGAQDGVDPAVQDMLDRAAIENMVVEYYSHLGGPDTGAFDRYFTEDAIFDVNGQVANGREEIEGIYASLRDDDTSAVADAGTFHMLLTNPVIEIDGDTATASFIWTGVANTSIDAPPTLAEQGREYDKLERQADGRWLFTHRVVIADSALPETMKATYDPRPDFSFDAEPPPAE